MFVSNPVRDKVTCDTDVARGARAAREVRDSARAATSAIGRYCVTTSRILPSRPYAGWRAVEAWTTSMRRYAWSSRSCSRSWSTSTLAQDHDCHGCHLRSQATGSHPWIQQLSVPQSWLVISIKRTWLVGLGECSPGSTPSNLSISRLPFYPLTHPVLSSPKSLGSGGTRWRSTLARSWSAPTEWTRVMKKNKRMNPIDRRVTLPYRESLQSPINSHYTPLSIVMKYTNTRTRRFLDGRPTLCWWPSPHVNMSVRTTSYVRTTNCQQWSIRNCM